VRARRLKVFGHDVALADKSKDHFRSLRACYVVGIAHFKELEAAYKAYLVDNGGGRPAPIQPRPRIRVSEGAEQNSLAGTHSNGCVIDKSITMRRALRLSIH